jgi:hypothetical protein
MTLYASLNGVQITSCRIVLPTYGIWHGDVVVATTSTIAGPVTIQIGSLTLTGTAYRMASFAGVRSVRVVGGAGGWQVDVPGQSYEVPNGVTAQMVLGDVAAAVGETLVLTGTLPTWTRYVREAMPASRILNQVLGATWWVDTTGKTQNAPRPSTAIVSTFQSEEFSGSKGRFTIATESPQDWMPGNTFSSPTITTTQTISSTTIVMSDDGRLRLDVLTNTAAINAGDRLVAELQSLIRETLPNLTFMGVYEYTVTGVGSGTCNANPTNTTLSLPPIAQLPLTFPLMTATLKFGDLIRVWFVNGSPTRPEVCSAPADSTVITVGNAATAAAARKGDSVASSLTIPDLTAIVAGILSSSGTLSINPAYVPFNITGTITSGSSQVQIG